MRIFTLKISFLHKYLHFTFYKSIRCSSLFILSPVASHTVDTENQLGFFPASSLVKITLQEKTQTYRSPQSCREKWRWHKVKVIVAGNNNKCN